MIKNHPDIVFCPFCDHLQDNPEATMCGNCFTELSLDALQEVAFEAIMDDDFDDECSAGC